MNPTPQIRKPSKGDRVKFTPRPDPDWTYYPVQGTVIKQWNADRSLVQWDKIKGYDHSTPKPENNDELEILPTQSTIPNGISNLENRDTEKPAEDCSPAGSFPQDPSSSRLQPSEPCHSFSRGGGEGSSAPFPPLLQERQSRIFLTPAARPSSPTPNRFPAWKTQYLRQGPRTLSGRGLLPLL